MKTLFFLAIFSAVFICSDTTRAQERLLFDHLGVANGLSQGSVICILQDSRGFLWFGTQDGLNKFDGYDCKVFKHDPADSNSITDNFILSIAEDSAHTIWVGTLNNPELLNRFDRETETFKAVKRDSVHLGNARVGTTHPEYTDQSGTRWFGGVGSGFQRFDPRTGVTKNYKHDPADPKSLLDDRVYSVVGDKTGAIWVATRGGLEKFDPRTESFTHYMHNDKDPHSLKDNFVWPVLEDASGTIWVGTYRGGLHRYNRSTDNFTRYDHNDTDPRSLAGDQIYSLYQDASGIIWVGTGDHGVDRFTPGPTGISHYLREPESGNTLADNNILSMMVDQTGIVWIGTRAGLNRLDRRTGEYLLFTHDPANPRSIASNTIAFMLQDRSGALWFGSENNGLDRLDPGSTTFVHYQNEPSNPHSLSDNRVYALCEDRSGTLWVGTYAGGLCSLDASRKSFTRFTHSDSVSTSLAAAGAWALCEDRDGVLWVGTFGGGVDRMNKNDGTFTHYHHSTTDPKSLSDDNVLTLCSDRSGTLWVGTTGGVNKFNPATGSFQSYHETDGLANDVVFGILEDNAGKLWMSTNKGISRFDPEHSAFHNFVYADGLQGNEFNQGAYAKDLRSGELFFGGANGFNILQPDRIVANSYIPPVVFSGFIRYNTDDREGRPIVERGIDAKKEIVLSYKDNVVNFRFASLNFKNTFRNRYQYRLEGYDKNWIQLGTDRTATFTNLDAGTYTLRVRGSNNDGVWNDAGAALSLIVTPPWWKTRWAYFAYGVLILSTLISIQRFEINRREQKARVRESELRAKAAEAEKRALQAENDRKTKELEDARNLQLSMLPREVPKHPGYEISVFMKTATEVGGDYYDFNPTPEGTLNIAFGDATGHGMQAGTIVTLMKGLFISDAAHVDIKTFFNRCSGAIKEIKLGRLYMALTLARLDGIKVSLSSAGMPPAYLYRNGDGSIDEILLKATPLGAMKNFPYALFETTMGPGDTLLFLTDGLPEQKNEKEEMFDYARVVETFREVAVCPPQEIIDRLVSESERWMANVHQDDDITLMVVRKTAEA